MKLTLLASSLLCANSQYYNGYYGNGYYNGYYNGYSNGYYYPGYNYNYGYNTPNYGFNNFGTNTFGTNTLGLNTLGTTGFGTNTLGLNTLGTTGFGTTGFGTNTQIAGSNVLTNSASLTRGQSCTNARACTIGAACTTVDTATFRLVTGTCSLYDNRQIGASGQAYRQLGITTMCCPLGTATTGTTTCPGTLITGTTCTIARDHNNVLSAGNCDYRDNHLPWHSYYRDNLHNRFVYDNRQIGASGQAYRQLGITTMCCPLGTATTGTTTCSGTLITGTTCTIGQVCTVNGVAGTCQPNVLNTIGTIGTTLGICCPTNNAGLQQCPGNLPVGPACTPGIPCPTVLGGVANGICQQVAGLFRCCGNNGGQLAAGICPAGVGQGQTTAGLRCCAGGNANTLCPNNAPAATGCVIGSVVGAACNGAGGAANVPGTCQGAQGAAPGGPLFCC